MRLPALIGLMLAGLLAVKSADFVHRLMSPDLVAQAFAEGGDDAYYFFTVARNVATGHGITIDGVHWTTGFQPLWAAICALAFAVAPDRGALGLLYVASVACWLGGAWLLIRFVRTARGGDLSPLAAALIATLFLCESQVGQNYFNGMETGLYITFCLVLLVAFQRHLQGEPASDARLVWLGVLTGLTMLSRNDGVFLCGPLVGAVLVSGTRLRPVREALTIRAVWSPATRSDECGAATTIASSASPRGSMSTEPSARMLASIPLRRRNFRRCFRFSRSISTCCCASSSIVTPPAIFSPYEWSVTAQYS